MNKSYAPFLWENAQQEYIEKIAALLKERYSSPPGAYVRTYGCQQNVSDSERFSGMLSRMGYRPVAVPEEAELILFNTCAVREHAEERVLGNVGALKKYKQTHPGVVLALCGCMTQQQSVADRIKRSFPYVDMVLGTDAVYRLPELLYTRLTAGRRVFDLSEGDRIYEDVPVRRDGSCKGWLPVMYGCDNFCTYCVVPYVRGRERSRRPEDILHEFRQMLAAGCRDITLLGQNVNSYGKGVAGCPDFAGLLRLLCREPGEFILRFMTSHPKDCTDDLLDTIAGEEKISRHLHLPFQSGSDRVLKAMNRRYDRAGYLDLIRRAKRKIPDVCLTSDIIVGFPGETREDFLCTLRLVKEVEFTSLFTFIYSPREGTPAAQMPDPIPMEEKKAWFSELLAAQEEIAVRRAARDRGRSFRLLCEESDPDRPALLRGHTSGGILTEFSGDSSLVGQFVTVRAVETTPRLYRGEIAE